ncbi:MAG: hypothetical protein EOS14_31735 [Mesorhizobium sp.]|nr:MAG: hypothetical protein EOS14_31735 [Mesorhizobium sp.]
MATKVYASCRPGADICLVQVAHRYWRSAAEGRIGGEATPVYRTRRSEAADHRNHPWLTDHQEIGTIARDRGGGYGEAAAKALPHAIQVATGYHC